MSCGYFSLSGHLYLNRVWLLVNLRTNTIKDMCIKDIGFPSSFFTKFSLHFIVNTIGRIYCNMCSFEEPTDMHIQQPQLNQGDTQFSIRLLLMFYHKFIKATYITSFKFITMFYGTNNIPRNILSFFQHSVCYGSE